MASTVSRKKRRSRATPRTRRVADLTTDELRDLIEQLLDRKMAEYNPVSVRSSESTITPPMRQRAFAVAGRFHSGRSDISSQHDEYLAASFLG